MVGAAEGRHTLGWNYRVMRHTSDPKDGSEGEESYAIHEIYYRCDDVDDLTVTSSEVEYTMEPVSAVAGNADDLRWQLEEMLKALDKPILEYSGEEPEMSLVTSKRLTLKSDGAR